MPKEWKETRDELETLILGILANQCQRIDIPIDCGFKIQTRTLPDSRIDEVNVVSPAFTNISGIVNDRTSTCFVNNRVDT